MPFNSLAFFVFFLIVYLIYRGLSHKFQNLFLLVASYAFYGWWDVRFLFLIILATCLDFTCSLMIGGGPVTKRQRLTVSAWVVGAAFLFLVVQWNSLGPALHGAQFSWRRLFSWRTGWLLFFGVILLTLVLNFAFSRVDRIAPARKRKIFLMASILGNLAILGFFKYFNFFLGNFEAVLRHLGLPAGHLQLDILLPIGISFYTFMTMSYTIDVYRGSVVPTPRLQDYALYVAFFPKLLAGPIERATTFMPQITAKRDITGGHITRGLQQILYGLFKKVVIADGVAITVNTVFGGTYRLSWADALVGTLLFAFQIYCDFSGYSDMAIGIASLLGFDLMRNFHFPYFSRNSSEFWGRWHISLSSWFRDYVFFPLGGPYGRTSRWLRNIFITFFVTGLWHGAAWNYVLWGMYHGGLLGLHRVRESLRPGRKPSRNPIRKAASIAAFFALTAVGWILFRSHSLAQIKDILKTLVFDFGHLKLNAELPTSAALVGLPLFILMETLGYRSHGQRLTKVMPLQAWTAVYSAMIFLIILGLANVPTGFIYFVF